MKGEDRCRVKSVRRCLEILQMIWVRWVLEIPDELEMKTKTTSEICTSADGMWVAAA